MLLGSYSVFQLPPTPNRSYMTEEWNTDLFPNHKRTHTLKSLTLKQSVVLLFWVGLLFPLKILLNAALNFGQHWLLSISKGDAYVIIKLVYMSQVTLSLQKYCHPFSPLSLLFQISKQGLQYYNCIYVDLKRTAFPPNRWNLKTTPQFTNLQFCSGDQAALNRGETGGSVLGVWTGLHAFFFFQLS